MPFGGVPLALRHALPSVQRHACDSQAVEGGVTPWGCIAPSSGYLTAAVAQLDRARSFYLRVWGFDSLQPRQLERMHD